jgi:hypothetical protein
VTRVCVSAFAARFLADDASKSVGMISGLSDCPQTP